MSRLRSGFQRAQVVRKAEGQVQKAAVDRTDFRPSLRFWGAALGFSASGRRACCALAYPVML